jgi:hypothetical protein
MRLRSGFFQSTEIDIDVSKEPFEFFCARDIGRPGIPMISGTLSRSMLICIALLAMTSISRQSAAYPPDPRSGDGQLIAPYRDAVRSLSQRNGVPCCSESDCRPAEYRINSAGGYEVFIRQLTKDGSGWEDGPDKWLEVPSERVTSPSRRPNLPFGIACWKFGHLYLSGGFICFTPGTGM